MFAYNIVYQHSLFVQYGPEIIILRIAVLVQDMAVYYITIRQEVF